MGVPTSGSFSMFGNSDNTTIQGAITEGGGSVASTDNLNDLIAASNVSLFDTTYSGDLSGSLSNVTNANQYRGYPTLLTAFAFTYTFPAGGTYAADIDLDGTSSEYNATWTWGDGATTSITNNNDVTRTIADNSGGASVSTYNGNVVAATTETFPEFTIDNFNITDITNWGNIKWKKLKFKGASTSLNISASDTPDLSRCTHLTECFRGLTSFNYSNVTGWNVSNVTDMSMMFFDASAFNQDVSSWDVSSVTNMSKMFEDASAFNQNLNSWDVSNVTTMNNMFNGASAFNQNLNSWDVSNVTIMSGMFRSNSFNSNITSWDLTSLDDARNIFMNNSSFNQNISNWDTSNIRLMGAMFNGADAFNQDISSWDTGTVTQMFNMFNGASAFNQNISSWDTSNVTDMGGMFNDASAFNQNLSSWDVSNVTDMGGMFRNTSLSDANYKAIIIGWAAQSTQNNVTAHFGSANLTDSAGQAARTTLVNRGWTITDGDGFHT